MAPRYQPFLAFFFILSVSFCSLAAPTLSAFSASIVTESIIELPTADPSAPVSSSAGPNAALSSASSSSPAAVLSSDVAAGSFTWVATTESILVMPRPSNTFSPSDSASANALDVAPSSTTTLSSNADAPSTSSVTPTQTASITRTTLYVPPSSTIAGTNIQDAVASSSSMSPSPPQSPSNTVANLASVSVKSSATDITDPNPTMVTQAKSNAATQQARRSAVVAAFLTIGTLIILGTAIICMRCKLPSRLSHIKRRSRRVRFDLPPAEQSPMVTSIFGEKDEKNSLVPGPLPPQEVTLPVLPRQSRAESGASGQDVSHNRPSDWKVYTSNVDGQFEDVTHILSTNVFAPLERNGNSPGADSALSLASRASTDEVNDELNMSRASGSASLTGVSYKSCDSRYSTPSIERQSRDGPSGSGSTESISPSLLFCRSPSPPSPDIAQTPEPTTYADSPKRGPFGDPGEMIGSKQHHILTRVTRESEEIDLASEWDIARAYGDHSSVGKDSVLSVIVEHMEPVEVGGRKCVLVQG